MNLKNSVMFFSAGIILVLLLFLIGVPINVIPASQQQQEITGDLDLGISSKDNDDKKQTTTEKIIATNAEKTKPIEKMDCAELKEFAMSFQKGWGSAVPLYDEKCS